MNLDPYEQQLLSLLLLSILLPRKPVRCSLLGVGLQAAIIDKECGR